MDNGALYITGLTISPSNSILARNSRGSARSFVPEVAMRTGPTRKWAAPALFGVFAVVVGLAIAGMPGSAQQKGEWPAITGGDTSTR
jgi:hypothetical protein